jgi:cyclopropane-fatty-acyl-phospholipid synthase
MKRLLDSIFRRVVRQGNLEVAWASGGTTRYGSGEGPSLRLVFNDKATQWRVASNPELYLGEAYMEGGIRVEGGSLYDVLALLTHFSHSAETSRWIAALARCRVALRRLHQRNTLGQARRNVAHHYDLDARLYRLFLDDDLQYSCAYFPHDAMSLDEAQRAKKRHIAAKLALEPGCHVLDIGSGWGGLSLSLADWAGVRVTGVTLSSEQQQIATERAVQAGHGSDVQFLLKDYRELTGRFDRIVSVGMFEHVGIGHYDEFFRSCAQLLAEDGVMLLHSIGRCGKPGATNPWVNKYIFPGGYIPALSEVFPAIERAGLLVTDMEILRLHYAETLRAWRERFLARREEAARIYDERFVRMWEFYLAGSELAFRNQDMMVFQLQLTKDQSVLPLTRGYIEEAERRLALQDADGESLRMAGE